MKQAITALVLFGISFGYVEAAVVVYLRSIYEPIRQGVSPRPANDLFPLITVEQLRASGSANVHRLATELGREAATILMLASIALSVARTFQQWTAAFLIAFGLWDISFYLFLKVLINWPASWFTWDLLFLIPVPWASPVIAPVIVSLSMIGCGLTALRRPIRIGMLEWSAIVLGGLIVVISFTLDYRNTMAGGMPNPFNWTVFISGELIGLAAFCSAALKPAVRGSDSRVRP